MGAHYVGWKMEGTPPSLRNEEFERLMFWAAKALSVQGAFCEFGVYKGGSAGQLCRLLRDNDLERELHLFDAWRDKHPNMSKLVRPKGEKPRGIMMSSAKALDLTKQNIQTIDPESKVKVFYHPGYFEETLSSIKKFPVAFIHFDADLYYPALQVIKFADRNMVSGGVIVFHDVYHPDKTNCWKALYAVVKKGLSSKRYELLWPFANHSMNRQLVAIRR